jgi:hypothetical protein
MDPELKNWQSSLSAQQLSAHTAKPHTDFSKAFGDTKYMENGYNGFTTLHRGTIDKPLDPDPDGREYSMPELTRQLGQHWTTDKNVANTFATNSGQEGDARKGRVFTGLVHNKDIWDPQEEGAEDHFSQYGIWHPNDGHEDEYEEDGFGEAEETVKPGSPVVLKKIDTYKTDMPLFDRSDPRFGRKPSYDKKSVNLKSGTIGRVNFF